MTGQPGYGKNIVNMSRSVNLNNIPPSSTKKKTIHSTASSCSSSPMKPIIKTPNFYSPIDSANKLLSMKNIFTNNNIVQPYMKTEKNEFKEKYMKHQEESAERQKHLNNQNGNGDANNNGKDLNDFKEADYFAKKTTLKADAAIIAHQLGFTPNILIKDIENLSIFNSFNKGLITVDNLNKNITHRLLNLAHDLRNLVVNEKDLTSMLRGKVVALMFFEPSTRTSCSFSSATQRLGGTCIYMDQQHSSVKKV
jgi:hypothetical protein